MHTVSKKDCDSVELETMRTSRSPTTVMTANGEVQTREEATTFVKQLDVFVKVFQQEETLAESFLGETLWGSRVLKPLGQRSETTFHQKWQKNRLQNIKRCTICGSWFLSVLNYTFTYLSIIFITGFRFWCQQIQRKIQYKMGNAKKYEKMYRMNCLIGIWSMKTLQQQCFGKTQSTEVKTLPNQFPMEPRVKVEPCSGKHSVYTHFPKHPNCDVCMNKKTTRTSCRRRTGTIVPRAEYFGDLITADQKVLSEESESQKNIDMPWWKKIWQHSGHNHTRVNKIFQGNPEGLHEVSGADEETISHLHWKFLGIWQSLWRSFQESNYPGNIARKHRTEQEQMGLPKEQRAEWKEGHLWCCCSPVWVTNGGPIPWNVTAICETFKNSCLTGIHHVKGGSECPLTDQ